MDTAKAVFFGLALVAAAMAVSDGFAPARADASGARYAIASDASLSGYIWVVDGNTGRVRSCQSGAGLERPKCNAWSDN